MRHSSTKAAGRLAACGRGSGAGYAARLLLMLLSAAGAAQGAVSPGELSAQMSVRSYAAGMLAAGSLADPPGVLADAEEPQPTAPVDAADSAAPLQAIWKTQEIDFYFQSFSTFYACTALERKIERILRALGAHAEVRVRSVACPAGIARMPRVSIRASSPVEATPQALAEQEEGRSKRELIARVRGERGDVDTAMEPFAAQWKRVSLGRGRLDLDSGDCELVEQLSRKVLPKLSVRVIEGDLNCGPHRLGVSQPRLELEALIELPKPDEAPSAR